MSTSEKRTTFENQENVFPYNCQTKDDSLNDSRSGSSGISSYPQTPHPELQNHSLDDYPDNHHSYHQKHPVYINRRILQTDDVFSPSKSSSSKTSLCLSTSKFLKEFLPTSFTKCPPSPWSLLTTLFPILGWLRTYRLKEDLLADIITGVTILALHIPQGLAYGRLAGVEPINGLYVSLFPVVVYALFGGSHQISIGTFAVISIACRDVLDQVLATKMVDGEVNLEPNKTMLVSNLSTTFSSFLNPFGDNQAAAMTEQVVAEVTAIEVLTSLCLLVGIIQFVLGIFHLGIVATLLSDPIISAFCVAAAMHVFTSQVFALVDVSSAAGPNEPNIPFDVIKSWYRLGSRITTTNPVTAVISGCTMAVLYTVKDYLEPYLKRRFRLKSLAIPVEIISIVVLTGLSYAFDLNSRFQVAIIPKIAAGFDGLPISPRLDLWPRLAASAFLLAFICYASTYSLEKMYAAKHGYEVGPNQELLAMGVANTVSSFFLCYPCAGSLARSAVQDKVGGRTQLASLISSGLICLFIIFFSKFLETLPKCALSSIIVVALISSFRKFAEVKKHWAISKLDGLLWVATFLLVALIGVDKGLLYSLAIGLLLIVFRLAIPQLNLKHPIPETECYIAEQYGGDLSVNSLSTPTPLSNELPIVFEFYGPLIFINVERFKSRFNDVVISKLTCLDSERENKKTKKAKDNHFKKGSSSVSVISFTSTNGDGGFDEADEDEKSISNLTKSKFLSLSLQLSPPLPDHYHHHQQKVVIFDMIHVPYIDGKGATSLREVSKLLKQKTGAHFLLATVSPLVLDTFKRTDFFDTFDRKLIFLTLADAIAYASNFQNEVIENEQKDKKKISANDADAAVFLAV